MTPFDPFAAYKQLINPGIGSSTYPLQHSIKNVNSELDFLFSF